MANHAPGAWPHFLTRVCLDILGCLVYLAILHLSSAEARMVHFFSDK